MKKYLWGYVALIVVFATLATVDFVQHDKWYHVTIYYALAVAFFVKMLYQRRKGNLQQ